MGVRQGCFMSPSLFNVYMDGVMNEVKMGMGSRGESEEGRLRCADHKKQKWGS